MEGTADMIRIHLPIAGHTYGIEYNFNMKDADKDASNFISACRNLLDKRYGWFWQCGSNSNRGYQYFEMLGCSDEEIFINEVEKIANALGCEITFDGE